VTRHAIHKKTQRYGVLTLVRIMVPTYHSKTQVIATSKDFSMLVAHARSKAALGATTIGPRTARNRAPPRETLSDALLRLPWMGFRERPTGNHAVSSLEATASQS